MAPCLQMARHAQLFSCRVHLQLPQIRNERSYICNACFILKNKVCRRQQQAHVPKKRTWSPIHTARTAASTFAPGSQCALTPCVLPNRLGRGLARPCQETYIRCTAPCDTANTADFEHVQSCQCCAYAVSSRAQVLLQVKHRRDSFPCN